MQETLWNLLINHRLQENISFKVAYPWNTDAETTEVDDEQYPTNLDDK